MVQAQLTTRRIPPRVPRVPTKSARETPDATGPSLLDLYLASDKTPLDIAIAGGPSETHWSKVVNGKARMSELKLRGVAQALGLDREAVRAAYSVSRQRGADQ